MLDIMKEVSRYAAKHGVIVRNEDVGLGTKDPYALHNVDMYDDDVIRNSRLSVSAKF